MTDPSLHTGVPAGARRLIWDVFFANGGRGVSFDAHLPWADAPETRSVTIGGEAPHAALVIRPAPQPGVGMIGFVCVDAQARGQGHAAALLRRAHAAMDEAGVAATLLWTRKPEVYVGSGYRMLDRDRFLTLTAVTKIGTEPVRHRPWPDVGDTAGLPAFATSGARLSNAHASAVIVEGPGGVTLIDWFGEPDAVAALIDSAGHSRWSVNLPGGSGFDKALAPALFTIGARDGAFAMIRCANPSFAIEPVPVADRI